MLLGCGLGMHVLQLLQHRNIDNLIIYEPEIQYFQCSSLVNKWDEIFTLARQQNCQIFIQLEKDGRDIINDMLELTEHKNVSHFYLYQHYNHPVFNSLYQELLAKPWSNIRENGISFSPSNNYNHYVPTWTPSIPLNSLRSVSLASPVLAKNLTALQKYFPNIYAEFKDYQPEIWLPVLNQQGEVNIIKADSLRPWYSEHPKQDCEFNYQNFNEQPNKDGLVLGYKGTKLAHYLHYQFVKQTEELLEKAEEEVGALPENVASIIMFGIGVGYQIETLLANHKVEKLFLCEPNTDFFYASLFAIDWLAIFETIDRSNARIYLNIGDDGSHLFRDLLGQFHSIGPYILNSTYFYQSYYNASLNTAIAQLREQLQVVISMGEYFDHAYYGIEHTKEGMRRQYPLLVSNPSSKLSYDDKEVPVFIIGNGPSLDMSIEAIKEWRDQAIVISCGTALQALYRHGITPDFHAEIEQNRSTYDWPVLIGDLDYLKNITLISCNGIHPDTATLYKDVLLAFKEGESSTVSALSVLDRKQFEVLQHAFPTVSNFVCDLVSTLGFSHIYLMGVDLGFVDVKHHHSKSSGYYKEDGKETYDYSESNNTSLVVPGNFRPTVNTKHEFKVSRQIIEQVTYKKPKTQNFYNCSDGARIKGANPLRIEQLLIVVSPEQKQHAIKQICTQLFTNKHIQNFTQVFENKYSQQLLHRELSILQELSAKPVVDTKQVKLLINKQKEMLYESYRNGQSLLFYYLYGTLNFFNAMLTKLQAVKNDNKFALQNVNDSLRYWQRTITNINDFLKTENRHFDSSEFSQNEREKSILSGKLKNQSLLIITDSISFSEAYQWGLKSQFHVFGEVTISPSDKIPSHDYDFVIYACPSIFNDGNHVMEKLGQRNTLVMVNRIDMLTKETRQKVVTMLCVPSVIEHSQLFANQAIFAVTSLKICTNVNQGACAIPRTNAIENINIDFSQLYATNNHDCRFNKAIVFTYYALLFDGVVNAADFISNSASRGRLVTDLSQADVYVYRFLPQTLFDEAHLRFNLQIPGLRKKTPLVHEVRIISQD